MCRSVGGQLDCTAHHSGGYRVPAGSGERVREFLPCGGGAGGTEHHMIDFRQAPAFYSDAVRV